MENLWVIVLLTGVAMSATVVYLWMDAYVTSLQREINELRQKLYETQEGYYLEKIERLEKERELIIRHMFNVPEEDTFEGNETEH